jgi:hypothetical protein
VKGDGGTGRPDLRLEALSGAELESLAEVSDSDVEDAVSLWRSRAPEALQSLLDAPEVP